MKNRKSLIIFFCTVVSIFVVFFFVDKETYAAANTVTITVTQECSIWSKPNTSEQYRVKKIPAGHQVTIYTDVIQSTKGDGKTFYKTIKGSYILCKCFAERVTQEQMDIALADPIWKEIAYLLDSGGTWTWLDCGTLVKGKIHSFSELVALVEEHNVAKYLFVPLPYYKKGGTPSDLNDYRNYSVENEEAYDAENDVIFDYFNRRYDELNPLYEVDELQWQREMDKLHEKCDAYYNMIDEKYDHDSWAHVEMRNQELMYQRGIVQFIFNAKGPNFILLLSRD